MRAHLIAHTDMTFDLPERIGASVFGARLTADIANGESEPDLLAELAGRACYESYELPNPATRDNASYLANIVAQQHFSVLEHASATFYIEGVSRSLTHELIRHRHLSYSELSQRYVDVESIPMVVPPAYRDAALDDGAADLLDEFSDAPLFAEMRDEYRAAVTYLRDVRGLSRKRAREAARCLMPNATETRIVVTGNMRAWRDFLGKRWHVAADAEIRELAGELLSQLRGVAPASFADVPELPYGSDEL